MPELAQKNCGDCLVGSRILGADEEHAWKCFAVIMGCYIGAAKIKNKEYIIKKLLLNFL